MDITQSIIYPDRLITLSEDRELTPSALSELLTEHKNLVNERYLKLKNSYIGDYPILHASDKENYKPDNRIVVNFAKYIVDTMNGFFIGIPIKVNSKDEKVAEYLTLLDQYNDQEDNNAELARICSIYGKGYEIYYNDENAQVAITYLSPLEGFMVYDETVLQKPRYFVSYAIDSENIMHGEIRDESKIIKFTDKGNLHFEEEILHNFDGIPATEFIENEERMSIFEPCWSMINAYNKAISEKANDVDYFADAYLKIIGPSLDEGTLNSIRDNRIINLETSEAEKAVVDFMEKPNADATQENLINRLERLIFQNSMVANINDENFGTSSGIALKYKLLSMSNLAKTKERKFTSGMNNRYKVIFSNPINSMNSDDWLKVDYKFTLNFPSNLQEEAQIASQLSGIVSQETQLSVLSVVSNVKEELERIENEGNDDAIMDQYFNNNQKKEELDVEE
nr:MAG: portal protein [Bacteriophage sp.]